MEHYGLYHAQIQAEGFMDLKQIAEKNSHSLQHLLEHANSLEVRLTTIEKTQSNLDQKMSRLMNGMIVSLETRANLSIWKYKI